MAEGCSQAHIRWTVISLNMEAHHRCSLPTLQPLPNTPRQGLHSPLWYDAWLDGNCYSRQHQLVKAYQLMRSPRADASPALFPNTHTHTVPTICCFLSLYHFSLSNISNTVSPTHRNTQQIVRRYPLQVIGDVDRRECSFLLTPSPCSVITIDHTDSSNRDGHYQAFLESSRQETRWSENPLKLMISLLMTTVISLPSNGISLINCQAVLTCQSLLSGNVNSYFHIFVSISEGWA